MMLFIRNLYLLSFFTLTISTADTTIKKYESLKPISLETNEKYSMKTTSRIFRMIENSGSYRIVKHARSTALGAYQFINSVRRNLIYKLKGITHKNWHLKKNQDRMFFHELEKRRKSLRRWTTDSIYKQYMCWQLGNGGFKRAFNLSRKPGYGKEISYKSIFNNFTPIMKRDAEIYLRLKMGKLSKTYNIRLSSRDLKRKRMSFYTFKRYVRYFKTNMHKTRISSKVRNILHRSVKKHLVIHLLNHYKHKVDHYINTTKGHKQ